jgi:tetratricopeptide (TPR) repeat protein
MRPLSPLVVSLLWAARLAAQEPGDRSAIERLRDSLGDVGDSVALRRLEATTIALAKDDRDNPLLHLRLGFIAHRLGELGRSKAHFDDAAGEFEWAAELKPEWPYPWYGLGLAELAQGEHSAIAIENLRQQLGLDHLSKAARAFARAAQADPSFAFAAIDLANAALTQRIRARLQVALETVRLAAASSAGRVPDVQLARGRVEREVGEADSALAAFHAYLAVGGDSGVGLFELSRTQFFAHQPAAAESSYYRGARAATSDLARALYREDVALLAEPAQLRAFDAQAGGAARAAWLARFWNQRDQAELRTPGERLAEHNRRWLHAHRNFRLVSRHRHYDITEVYRSAQAEFDDRGVIYLRHGEPDAHATFPSDLRRVQPNLSWLYHRAGGDLVFHFVARDDASDYKLVESLVDALGFRAAVQATGAPDTKVTELYASREQFGGAYARVARGGTLAGRVIADERTAGRNAIVTGTTTDSYRQRFAIPLDLVVSDFVAAAGSAPGAAQSMHVVFAIPADRLAPVPGVGGGSGGGSVLYPLHFRLLVSDERDSLVAQLDTLRVFGAHQILRSPSFLSGRLSVPLAAGRYFYRLLVNTPDQLAGQLVRRDTLLVPALDGQGFTASDLVTGRVGGGLVWLPRTRPDSGTAVDTVLLNPLERYPAGSVTELYYELSGLAPGASYHTEIRLERVGGRSLFARIGGLFGGGRPPVLLEFDAVATGSVTRIHRGVSLRGVAPGSYVLSVVLTDPASGSRVTRQRRLQVVATS